MGKPFAPHCRLEKILYAILALMLPYTILKVYPKTGDDTFLFFACIWWVITTFYTATWITGAVRGRWMKKDISCTICGHPGPFVPEHVPEPDPRKNMKVLCTVCDRDITYDTHQWRSQVDDRWVCCTCMVPTKPLRDMMKGK